MTVFLLSGCEGLPLAPDFAPQRAFSVILTATVNGRRFAGVMTCDSYESLSLALSAPEELAGFTVRTEGGGYRIGLNGLADDLPRDDLKPDAPLRLLFDAVRAAVFTNHGAFTRDKEAGCYSAALTVNGLPVTAAFTEDGLLRSLTAGAVTAEFAGCPGSGQADSDPGQSPTFSISD